MYKWSYIYINRIKSIIDAYDTNINLDMDYIDIHFFVVLNQVVPSFIVRMR